ncbi:MAG: type II secretion system protein J [Elusimicrobiota bacterium]
MSRRRILRRRRNSRSGFSLVELIIATVLSGFVLIGTFSLLTNMVTAEVNGMRKGTVTAWTLAGIGAMNADIAGAGALAYPIPGGQANSLVICTNWAMKFDAAGAVMYTAVIDKDFGNTVTSYCWDTQDPPPHGAGGVVGAGGSLLRSVTVNAAGAAACPTGAPPACTQTNYSNGQYQSDTLVAAGVYPDSAGDPIFTADPFTLNAVRLRFAVGDPTASDPNSPAGSNGTMKQGAPVSVPFDTEIILED